MAKKHKRKSIPRPPKKAARKQRRRRPIPGPIKGPASKMYHFNIIPKTAFSEFRVLDEKNYGHIYSPDLAHAYKKFWDRFNTPFPPGTLITVGRFKKSAPRYSWVIGKKGERLAWGIHKILVPLGFPVVPNPIPIVTPLIEKAMDWAWGKAPPEETPEGAPPESPEDIPIEDRPEALYPLTLIYEVYAGDNQSNFYTYNVFQEGKSFETAARAYRSKLMWTWDTRRARDLGMISITIIYFDPEKQKYLTFLVYGPTVPTQVVARLIGEIPTVGEGPGVGSMPIEDRPSVLGPPIITATSLKQGKEWGTKSVDNIPVPDVWQKSKGRGIQPEEPIAEEKAEQARRPAPGIPPEEDLEREMRRRREQGRTVGATIRNNPALQIETNPLALHLHGDAGRLGKVNLWGSLDEFDSKIEPFMAAKPSAPPPPFRAPHGPLTGPKPAKIITAPSNIAAVRARGMETQVPERIEIPSAPAIGRREIEARMDAAEAGRVELPTQSELEREISESAAREEAWLADAKAQAGIMVNPRGRKKACKRNPRKVKKAHKVSTSPGWKQYLVTRSRLQPVSWCALIGYLTGEKLTSPIHIVAAKAQGGKVLVEDSQGKTMAFCSLAKAKKWWGILTKKLSKVEKAKADKVFKQKLR